MTRKEAQSLHPGDEVFWNDPDDGKCSRTYHIRTIEVLAQSDIVIIHGYDGSSLECFASELS